MTFKSGVWLVVLNTFEFNGRSVFSIGSLWDFAISSAMHFKPFSFAGLHYQQQFKISLFIDNFCCCCRISFKMRFLLVIFAIGFLVTLAYAGKWIHRSGGTVFT